MRRQYSIWLDLIKLVGGFALIWMGYVFVVPLIPDSWKPDLFESDIQALSIEQEEELGNFILETFEIKQNDDIPVEVDSALWVIERRLLGGIGLTDYEYNIMVIDDPTVNALTLPGGNIIVFTGLIKLSDSPEEVAAVLAHEIGHVEGRHVVDKMLAEMGIGVVMAVLTGGDAGLIQDVTRSVVSNVFSRSQEHDADVYGLQLMERSGIHPRSLAGFFEKMNEENLGYAEELEWLMSHPHNNSRIKESADYQVNENFVEEVFDLDWTAVKASLQE